MSDCASRRPWHQQQTLRRFGGTHGSVNCTACSAAMVAEVVRCGPKLGMLGRDVRARSSEPTPDPKSPGLTLRQVAAAVHDIDPRVVLTVKQGIRWRHLRSRLLRGEVAVLQVQRQAFIGQGFGFGHAFAGPHAVAVGFDHDELWVDDPLARKFFPTWEQLAEAAAALVIDPAGHTVGAGRAWAAFGVRPRPAAVAAVPVVTHRIRFRPGRIFLYTMRGGRAVRRRAVAIEARMEAACGEPRAYAMDPAGELAGRPPQELVIVAEGRLRGFGIRPTAATVAVWEPGVDDVEGGDAPDPPASVAQPGAMAGEPPSQDPPVDAPDPDDPTSPDDADVPAADAAADDPDGAAGDDAGVRNGDVGEPLLPDGTDPEPEPDAMLTAA